MVASYDTQSAEEVVLVYSTNPGHHTGPASCSAALL